MNRKKGQLQVGTGKNLVGESEGQFFERTGEGLLILHSSGDGVYVKTNDRSGHKELKRLNGKRGGGLKGLLGTQSASDSVGAGQIRP